MSGIMPPLPGQPIPIPDWGPDWDPMPFPRRPRPFPWLNVIRRRREKERFRQAAEKFFEETQMNGAQAETKKTDGVNRCCVCGIAEDARPREDGGVMQVLEFCPQHAQRLACIASRQVSVAIWQEKLR